MSEPVQINILAIILFLTGRTTHSLCPFEFSLCPHSSPGLEGIEGATKVDIAKKIIQYLESNAGTKKIQKDKVNA